jgi:hypothetical protein
VTLLYLFFLFLERNLKNKQNTFRSWISIRTNILSKIRIYYNPPQSYLPSIWKDFQTKGFLNFFL